MNTFSLNDLLDVDLLASHVENGFVTKRTHDELDLSIYNYSPLTDVLNNWDSVTMKTRGLIVNSENMVVARSFDKFFNYSQLTRKNVDLNLTEQGTIMSKEDGSLGIAFVYNGLWHVSTRGSFHSDMAKHATKIMREKYSDTPYDGFSLLVEIVYPEGRIVQDYNGLDDLVLLGGMKACGQWIHPESIVYAGHRGDIFRGSLNDVLNFPDPQDTSEGFVFRYDNGFMVKVKHPSYLELHKAKYNTSKKEVFTMLKDNTFDSYLETIPDEFRDIVRKHEREIMSTYASLCARVDMELSKLTPQNSRKDTVLEINRVVDKDLIPLVIENVFRPEFFRDTVFRYMKKRKM